LSVLVPTHILVQCPAPWGRCQPEGYDARFAARAALSTACPHHRHSRRVGYDSLAFPRCASFRVLRDDQHPKQKERDMGLDMYASITTEKLDAPVDFKPKEASELHYWRKHPNLHGWMEALYYEKGGKADVFNCVTLALTLEDLDKLEQAVRNKSLPETSGFFFGQSLDEERAGDLDFVQKARSAIKNGYTVFYDSWW